MNEHNNATTRKTTHRIATLMMTGFWLVLFLILGAVGGEVWIRVKEQRFLALQAQQEQAQPRYYALRSAYRPFAVRHIHPHYLFFFPFDLQARRALNNDVCRVTDDGFRGAGPEGAGNRKLAFLLGGYAGLGYLAGHGGDDKTDVAETTIFWDGVHWHDAGNKIIAQEIVHYLHATMSSGQ